MVSGQALPDHSQRSSGVLGAGQLFSVLAIVFGAVALSELIGNVSIPLGFTKVVLFPFLWALLFCAAISVLQRRLDTLRARSVAMQTLSGHFVQVAILLFVAKLGFIVGENLRLIIDAGWILVLQEIGNFVGTMLLAMPVALLLGIKREAVGATFSIGRENGIAIISERYSMGSPEGRGVLAEYITGSVLGAVFMALLAAAIAQLGWFSPQALGMAAGIGSGSMTAAAVGALGSQFPQAASEIAALAAASNLITTVVGTYIILFVSLPFANWLYRKLEPAIGGAARAIAPEDLDRPAEVETGLPATLAALGASAAMALVGNRIATGTAIADALPGMLILLGATVVGMAIGHLTRRFGLPNLLWISLIGMILGATFSPFAASLNPLVAKLGLLPLVTPVLAFAGLALAKDLPLLRALGWRIIVVSLLANAGAFLAGATIAELAR